MYNFIKNAKIIISIINTLLLPYIYLLKYITIKDKTKKMKNNQSKPFALLPEWKRKQLITKNAKRQNNAFVLGMFILLTFAVLMAI